MSLTIERLDELAVDQIAFHDATWQELHEAIDYARERAARERCEALLPEDWMLRLEVHGDRIDFYAAIASYSYSLRHYRQNVGSARFCPFEMAHAASPAEAYLALAEALEARSTPDEVG
jgi:hypothetical protein